MSKTQIVVSGSIAIDRIMTFSGHYKDLIEPAKLHVISVGVLVDSSEIAQGGVGANISHNLASLGDEPVLLGSVGQDGADYIKKLNDLGVDTDSVHVSKLGTASFNVLNDSDKNQVGGFYPGAMSDSDSLSFEPWAKQPDTLFWIAPNDPATMSRLAEECRTDKLRLGYDPGQQVVSLSADDLKAGIEAAEIFMINEYELEVVTNKTGLTAEDIASKVALFITTRGENGSVIAGTSVGEPITIPAVKPTKVVDPGGAGDAYRGGFLHGYLQQWDVRKCGQLGATVASFVLEQFGPQIDFDLTKITQRYKEHFNEEIEL